MRLTKWRDENDENNSLDVFESLGGYGLCLGCIIFKF